MVESLMTVSSPLSLPLECHACHRPRPCSDGLKALAGLILAGLISVPFGRDGAAERLIPTPARLRTARPPPSHPHGRR